MIRPPVLDTDPTLDLMLERVVDVPPELVWLAWTTPEHLMPWFTPEPWRTVECQIDLRPGGRFRTVMRSPEGQLFPNIGCYLEVVKHERLVWTDALEAGFRPVKDPEDCGLGTRFTAAILLEPHGAGTKYTAIAKHGEEAGRTKHLEMGFQEGWGTALDQLVEYVKRL